MSVSKYDETERLYSPDGPGPDAETANSGEILCHLPDERRRWFTRTSISTSIYLAGFGISVLGAFFTGAMLTDKASQIIMTGAYCKWFSVRF